MIPLLLVVALLLCHGAFGPADQLLPTGSGPVAGHLTLAGSAAEQGGPTDSENPNYSYYAVSLLLVAGAVMWSRLTRGHRSTPIPIVWAFGGRPRPATLERWRGPTVFTLRVLRL